MTFIQANHLNGHFQIHFFLMCQKFRHFYQLSLYHYHLFQITEELFTFYILFRYSITVIMWNVFQNFVF